MYATVTDRLRLRGIPSCVLGEASLASAYADHVARGTRGDQGGARAQAQTAPTVLAPLLWTCRGKVLRDVVVAVPSHRCAAACPAGVPHPAAVALLGRPVVPMKPSRGYRRCRRWMHGLVRLSRRGWRHGAYSLDLDRQEWSYAVGPLFFCGRRAAAEPLALPASRWC